MRGVKNGNGAAKKGGYGLHLDLTDDERAELNALATILGISSSELVLRAVRNELKATEQAPTVKAAMDAIRGARESIKRKQALKSASA
jgi:hypothetical protein